MKTALNVNHGSAVIFEVIKNSQFPLFKYFRIRELSFWFFEKNQNNGPPVCMKELIKD
jgi:hypothetical protein